MNRRGYSWFANFGSNADLRDIQDLPGAQLVRRGQVIGKGNRFWRNITKDAGDRVNRIARSNGKGGGVGDKRARAGERPPCLRNRQNHPREEDRTAGQVVHPQQFARIDIEAAGDAVWKFTFLEGV